MLVEARGRCQVECEFVIADEGGENVTRTGRFEVQSVGGLARQCARSVHCDRLNYHIVSCNRACVALAAAVLALTRIRRIREEVARRGVLATHNFVAVAHTVVVRIPICNTGTAAEITARCDGARTIVVRCRRIVIASRSICTARDFQFIADAVSVCVVHTCSSAGVVSGRVGARTVVVRCPSIEVACRSIRAAANFELVAYPVAVRIVDACT